MNQALLDALARAKKVSEDLGARVMVIKNKEERARMALDLDLWEENLPKWERGVDFNVYCLSLLFFAQMLTNFRDRSNQRLISSLPCLYPHLHPQDH
jgi:hypothetical protein